MWCAKCETPIPPPSYSLAPKAAAKRLCHPCRAESSRTVGRIPSQLNAKIPVSEEARQVTLGSILGDGHLEHPVQSTGHWGLSIKHSLAQEAYLHWKAGILGPLVKKIDYPPDRVRLRTVRHPFFTELAKLVMLKNRKSVPLSLLVQVKDLGLGVWYLDDGCLTAAKLRPDGRRDKTTIRFSTCAFSSEENLGLRALLKLKLGLDSTKCSWVTSGYSGFNQSGEPRQYEGIRLYAENAHKFLKQVAPSLQGCGLNYKLDNA